MATNDSEPYKPPTFHHHGEVDLKVVGSGNCTGMTITENDQLLLCDCDKSRVLVFDKNNRFQYQIDTKYKPWDITALRGTQKAVASSYNGNYIEFIDLENRKRLKWVTLEGSAIGGIDSNKENMYVGGTGKIHVLDHHGNTTGNVKAKSKGTIWYITIMRGGRFCYSDFYNIFCVTADGTPLFSFKSLDLQNPQKVITDGHGYIYIVGYLSNNIHRLSPDGIFADIVLTERNGLDHPRALCFNRRYAKLFISNKDGKVFNVYNAK